MALGAIFGAVRQKAGQQTSDNAVENHKLRDRLLDVLVRTWHMGFTSFGGPPVHFQIFHRKFVDGRGKTPWIDEQIYQELFAICQALPGPGSTKMLFCIALFHAGFLPALFVFLLWSLPGALGMYGLAIGVGNINETLPAPAYALLSGLNASTVGLIALAAVQLASKAITDPLTRLLVLLGACAGLCYSALWYFPVLVVIGGVITMVWDCFLRAPIGRLAARLKRDKSEENIQRVEEESIEMSTNVTGRQSQDGALRRNVSSSTDNVAESGRSSSAEERRVPSNIEKVAHKIPVKWGLLIIAGFFASFIALMTVRGVLKNSPLELQLFQNMYLAGTIIFGGGPVVIPLLREYVVEPGWVSPRDFLIGLAIIQAFPGPNFNFAVYLGALTLTKSSSHALGAFLGFLGIFVPGITLAIGFQSLWRAMRSKPYVVSLLRGINATAVGLVFTAFYRLWEIGFLTPSATEGTSLGRNPWWVVVAAVTYVVVEWYKVPPAAAILSGGVLGLAWYGAVGY